MYHLCIADLTYRASVGGNENPTAANGLRAQLLMISHREGHCSRTFGDPDVVVFLGRERPKSVTGISSMRGNRVLSTGGTRSSRRE